MSETAATAQNATPNEQGAQPPAPPAPPPPDGDAMLAAAFEQYHGKRAGTPPPADGGNGKKEEDEDGKPNKGPADLHYSDKVSSNIDRDLEEKLAKRDMELAKLKRELGEARTKALEEIKGRAKENPDELAKELGIDPYQMILDGTPPPAAGDRDPNDGDPSLDSLPEAVRKKLEKLEAIEQRFEEQEKRDRERQLREYRDKTVSEAKKWLESSEGKKFTLLSGEPTSGELLFNAIVDTYKRNKDYYEANGTAPGFADVAESVEAQLDTAWDELMAKAASRPALIDKWHKHTGTAAPEKTPNVSAASQLKPTTTTLTNDASGDRPGVREPKTDYEIEQAAIRAIEEARQNQGDD